ncbi:hypothetical protein H5410_003172 [Solanum commersonii]|uniref:Uncharacterized protein n=1 Tax=Solanum commersonii TaxID=4109 RepID=A0A9J6B4X5_SOLCO|nr:hypothetical protein H5410_003172 [Solanum commersonii]
MHTCTFEQKRQLDHQEYLSSMWFNYRLLRETKKKLSQSDETLMVTSRRKPHIRVNNLIKYYVVGTCSESCKRKFSILDIVELVREELAIDILSLLPKASGKRPREEYKKSNISQKRKHTNRDYEQEDKLEAQRRSWVDEKLSSFVLRACMSEASSSSVLVEVGLISGVDVAMKSQTLTTTPPTSEGILDVSFSVPATTATTIYISGDTKTFARFPHSEA